MEIATRATALPELETDAPLAPLATIHVGGTADWMCRAASFRDVVQALAPGRAPTRGAAAVAIGKGSNLLVSDEEFAASRFGWSAD